MNVLCTNAQDAFPIEKAQVERLVRTFLNWQEVECEEISLHFVTKEEISHLHKLHFQDPSPTDCITFPIDPPGTKGDDYSVLGEVFVCPEVGIEYAEKHQIPPHFEVSLYIVHGLLHLLGYDDQSEEESAKMRRAEKSSMDYLKQNKALLNG